MSTKVRLAIAAPLSLAALSAYDFKHSVLANPDPDPEPQGTESENQLDRVVAIAEVTPVAAPETVSTASLETTAASLEGTDLLSTGSLSSPSYTETDSAAEIVPVPPDSVLARSEQQDPAMSDVAEPDSTASHPLASVEPDVSSNAAESGPEMIGIAPPERIQPESGSNLALESVGRKATVAPEEMSSTAWKQVGKSADLLAPSEVRLRHRSRPSPQGTAQPNLTRSAPPFSNETAPMEAAFNPLPPQLFPSQPSASPDSVFPELEAADDLPWSLTGYGGQVSAELLGEGMSISRELEGVGVRGFGLSRSLVNNRAMALEIEGQLLRHDNQGSSHLESTTALAWRWHKLPWDQVLDSSFAMGTGLSFASKVPAAEVANPGSTPQLLNYLFAELAIDLPQMDRWSLVTRYHQRTGLFGLFEEARGSAFYTTGLRYRF